MGRRGPKLVDTAGRQFGHLTVLAEIPGDKVRKRACRFLCACGRVCIKAKSNVTANGVRSCGQRCPFAWSGFRARSDASALALLARREAGESAMEIARSLGLTRQGVTRLLRRARQVREEEGAR
jgi:hypothetical protein